MRDWENLFSSCVRVGSIQQEDKAVERPVSKGYENALNTDSAVMRKRL